MTHKCFKSWNRLWQLNNRINLPWLCAEDFNELVRSSEKLEGTNRSQVQMQLFKDVIDEGGFINLGYVGSQFTYQKHFVIEST